MKLIGIIKNETTPKVCTDETMFTITQSDCHRGGGFCVVYSIGNGQVHDALSPSREVCKTLNCMVDPMKILIVKKDEDELGRHTNSTNVDIA